VSSAIGILPPVSPAPRGGRLSCSVRCAAALALLVIGFAAVGCGDTVIDGKNTEETLEKSLEGSLHAKIKNVDCPSDQKVEPGETFTCTVIFSDGKQATVTLKIRNEDADVSVVDLKPKN
jgi:hypothetical protein